MVAGCSGGQPSATTGLAAPTADTDTPTVHCSDTIGQMPTGQADHYRVVLDAVSVPPSVLMQVVATPGAAWPYWRKAGVAVRAGQTAELSVMATWQKRAAITWGSASVVSAVRFPACSGASSKWNAYAGGFYIRAPTECVPLSIRVGNRSKIVEFGVGRRCGNSRRKQLGDH